MPQVKFVPRGLVAELGVIIVVLRMPSDFLDLQMPVFEAIVEVRLKGLLFCKTFDRKPLLSSQHARLLGTCMAALNAVVHV